MLTASQNFFKGSNLGCKVASDILFYDSPESSNVLDVPDGPASLVGDLQDVGRDLSGIPRPGVVPEDLRLGHCVHDASAQEISCRVGWRTGQDVSLREKGAVFRDLVG